MTQWAFPMLSVDGDRSYNHTDFANFYKNLFSNGVALTIGNALRVKASPGGGMRLVVSDGASIINGYQYHNTEDLAFQVPVASSTQDRVDSIVIRHDVGARQIIIAYKQGDISVEQTALIWELQLATINIAKNTVNIFAENITDKRADEKVCGYSSPYQKVSVSGLETQYGDMLKNTFESFKTKASDNETDLQQLLTDQQALFQTWFSNLQDDLDANQASNLQLQIYWLTPTTQVFSIKHNLGYYPNVQVLYWEYGLGTAPLGEQPSYVSWDGEAPYTIPNEISHIGRNELNIKVPVIHSMTNPIVTKIRENEYMLQEGIKSMQIRIY
ncbi:structural protein [Desemzia incerta]|uniref:structural protein n=1 Tax=Desemzia incerta TaxID=82801 RepID=UPI003D061ED7